MDLLDVELPGVMDEDDNERHPEPSRKGLSIRAAESITEFRIPRLVAPPSSPHPSG